MRAIADASAVACARVLIRRRCRRDRHELMILDALQVARATFLMLRSICTHCHEHGCTISDDRPDSMDK